MRELQHIQLHRRPARMSVRGATSLGMLATAPSTSATLYAPGGLVLAVGNPVNLSAITTVSSVVALAVNNDPTTLIAVLAITVLALVFDLAWKREAPRAQQIPIEPAPAGRPAPDLGPHT